MYHNKAELEAAGYVLTPETWHTGKGEGEIYEQINSYNGTRDYQYLDTEGNVVAGPALTTSESVEASAEKAVEIPQPDVEADGESPKEDSQ